MARDSGGIVHLIHVVEGLSPLTVDPYGAYTDEVTAAMRQSGSKILEDAKMIAQAAGIPVSTELFDNFGSRVAEVVADAAQHFNADLVVVGTHGRRGIERLLMGNGAEQIIRLSPVSVLVIRSIKAKETSPK